MLFRSFEKALSISPNYFQAQQALSATQKKMVLNLSPNSPSVTQQAKPLPPPSLFLKGAVASPSQKHPSFLSSSAISLSQSAFPAAGKASQNALSALAISSNALTFGEQVGKGAYGEVFKGTWQKQPVAIKRLLASHLSPAVEAEFKHEASIMMALHSDHLIILKGLVLDQQPFCMVMNWMAKGSLYHVLHSTETLSLQARRQIALDMAHGLSFLHGKKILHRDLKSLNVLLDESLRARLCDFGLSKVKIETQSKSTLKGNEGAKGTLRWMAPELFGLKPKYSEKSDMYAYAMVMWELITRKIPFEEVQSELELREGIKQGEREEIPVDCPAPVSKLITWCWSQKPDDRPMANEVVEYIMKIPLPPEKEKLLVTEKSWHFDAVIKPEVSSIKASYQLLAATDKDKAKVVNYYQQRPVLGMDIKKIEVIYNPQMNRAFSARLAMLQERHGNPAFSPKFFQENESEWRQNIHQRFEQLAAPYTDEDYPDVKLLPLWHGTKPEVITSILKTGYANLATTDAGFFGKGLYSTCEAEYAYRVYSQGMLVVNWVSSYSPYPVMHGDMQAKLLGKGNYQNYDTHFAPVASPNASNPYSGSVYYPCKPGQASHYTEVVVFESSQCLPRYLVELQPSLPKSLSNNNALLNPPKALLSTLFKPAGIQFSEKEKKSTSMSSGVEKAPECKMM